MQGRTYGDLDIRCRTMEIAYQHHIVASRLFNMITPEITQHSWPTFFVFASVVIICQFGMQTTCPDSLFDYVEIFQMLRATRVVNDAFSGWLRTSEMFPLMQQRTDTPQIKASGDCGLKDALVVLEEAVNQSQYADSTGYSSLALKSLKDWINICDGSPRRWLHFIYWPASVPEEFMAAFKAGEHVALVLFLHWMAILRLAPPRWFMEYWIIRK